MAEIVLGIGTSHSPQLHFAAHQWHYHAAKDEAGRNYAELVRRAKSDMADEIVPERTKERDEACQRSLQKLSEVFEQAAPDVMITLGDDQHEQYLDDIMPMLCIFHGKQMPTGRHRGPDPDNWRSLGEYDQSMGPEAYVGHPELASHLVSYLCDAGFDLARSNQLKPDEGLGHAFQFVYRRLLHDDTLPMVPFMVNTYYPPNAPTPRRCYALGQALRQAVEAWDSDQRVAIIASGGLSHTVIDEEIDRVTIDAMMEKDPEPLWALPVDKLVGGTSEIRNWIIGAGALESKEMTLVDYVPTYRSLGGTGCGMTFAYWK